MPPLSYFGGIMGLEEFDVDLVEQEEPLEVNYVVDCKPDLFEQLCYGLYGCVTCED